MLFLAIASSETALTCLSSLNGYWYNLRTLSLNSFAYSLIQVPSCVVMVFILDKSKGSRKARALLGLVVVAATFVAGFSAQTAWVVQKDIDRRVPGPMMDWIDPDFAAGFVVYIIYASIYR